MNRVTLRVLCIAAGFFLAAGHPYYLSVTELRYKPADRSIEGSVKVFVHDLESALKKEGHPAIDLIRPQDLQATNRIVTEYLRKRFTLTVNGERMSFRLIGTEQEAEHFWMHLTYANCKMPKDVLIENAILYDHLKEQMNIVHLEVAGNSQSLKVANPEKTMRFRF